MIQLNDTVQIDAWYCEMNNHTGKVIQLPNKNDTTYLVELDNCRIWPFEEIELIKIESINNNDRNTN